MKALLVAALLLLIAVPAAAAAATETADPFLFAFTEAEDEQEAPTTTTISEGGVEPAEVAPPVDDEPAEDQWTAKFLAPAVAVLGLLGVVISFALYGLRVRSKYRVTE